MWREIFHTDNPPSAGFFIAHMKEMPMWYSAGTVAVTANSATVTGTGTAFSANARVGDAFRGPDGRWYEVTNIASATVLSIKPSYQGATASGQAYAIAPMQGYVKESADRLRQLVDQYGSQLAALQPWATSATPAAAREALGLGSAATKAAQASPTDTTAGALMAVGAFGLGTAAVFGISPVGFSSADYSPQDVRAVIGNRDGLYSFTGSAGQTLAMPPNFPQNYGMVNGFIGASNGYQYSWQEFTGHTGNRKWMRRATSATTWGAWSEVYHTGNILGTVSQSGGVPTGAIIERGSNANGSYVRLADGTQECWTHQVAAIAPGEVKGFTFTNAVGFVSEVPMSFASVSPEASTLEMPWGMEAHSANGAAIFVKNNNSMTRNVAVFFRTIGRWY